VVGDSDLRETAVGTTGRAARHLTLNPHRPKGRSMQNTECSGRAQLRA
jgi:hypothetical protein